MLHLNADGLAPRAKRSRTLIHRGSVLDGTSHGDWCPYGHDAEMPGDQREEDGRSLAFDTATPWRVGPRFWVSLCWNSMSRATCPRACFMSGSTMLRPMVLQPGSHTACLT